MGKPRATLAALTCAFTLIAGAACGPLIDGPASGGPNQPAPGAQDQAAVLAQLDDLLVAQWGSMAGYKRDRFPSWSSQGEGCDTRDTVLKRDGTGVNVGNDCKITAGTWVSVYDGETLTDPQDLDVDHMVPLANAWRTGAASWTDDKREQFANDLVRPQLIAVTASSNRSKGDQDPSQWKPPNRAYWCTYAQSWITVKAYWSLAVTTAEKAALADMLETC